MPDTKYWSLGDWAFNIVLALLVVLLFAAGFYMIYVMVSSPSNPTLHPHVEPLATQIGTLQESIYELQTAVARQDQR